MNVLFWRRRHAVSDTDLNAYVDRQLTPADRDRVEEHLRACDTCRETVEELRTLGNALRELPRASAPRSFALRQEDVSPPISEPRRPWSGRLPALAGAPTLAGGVAVFAFVAFWTLVSVDVLTQDSGGSAADGASQMRQGLPSGESAAEMDAMAPLAPSFSGNYADGLDEGGTTGPAEDGAQNIHDSPTPENGMVPGSGAGRVETPESEAGPFRDGATAEVYPDEGVQAMPEDGGAPVEPPPVAEAAPDDGDGIAPLRAAEAVSAAVVLGALGLFSWLRWRR